MNGFGTRPFDRGMSLGASLRDDFEQKGHARVPFIRWLFLEYDRSVPKKQELAPGSLLEDKQRRE